jgi:ABC-type spermidine/putrescine transport system permease subunit II
MNPANGDLALAPLGAGDLIDRAVRLYRRHFLTLIRIAAPPVLVSALGSTITTIAIRELTVTSNDTLLVLYVLMLLSGGVIMVCGTLFSIIVMGGATRNLVAHLIWNEPVTARATYSAVKSRFWALLGASVMVALWLGFAAHASER